MLDAIENNDNAIHFSETENTADARLVNRALNRVVGILYNVKSETAQQEKVLRTHPGLREYRHPRAERQWCRISEKTAKPSVCWASMSLPTSASWNRVDPRLSSLLANCRPGDKLQMPFNNERGTVNMSVRVSDITVRKEHLRILALNDINNELDEKEIDSWIRLTRVRTHEIMNAVTP